MINALRAHLDLRFHFLNKHLGFSVFFLCLSLFKQIICQLYRINEKINVICSLKKCTQDSNFNKSHQYLNSLTGHTISFTVPDNADNYVLNWAALIAQWVKNLPAIQETWVWFLGGKDLLEKEKATHFSILPCRIPWTKASRLQSICLQELDMT